MGCRRRWALQIAHPNSLVIDVAGEASILMNIQELSTVAQYRLPVKVFILNNRYMGMVRQWQEIMHGGRYSETYMDALPDFVKLAESFGAVGLRATKPDEVDGVIDEMIAAKQGGHRRHGGRSGRELLPDDSVGLGALRNDSGTRR